MDFRRIATIAVMLVLPFELVATVSEVPGVAPGYSRTIDIMLFDLPLLVLFALAVSDAVKRVVKGALPLGLVVAVSLIILGLIAWVFHPSVRGTYLLARLAVGAVVVSEISSLTRSQIRGRVAGPLLIATSLQGVIALAQTIKGGPLGIGMGELEQLWDFSGSTAGSGTLAHPYVLAGLAALSATLAIAFLPEGKHRRWWLGGIALTAVAIGVTFARSAALGLALGLVALAVGSIRRPNRYAAATAALVVGILIPAAVFHPGWIDRIEQSTISDLETNSSGRITHLRQAADVIKSSPVLGVGPGRYTIVLEADHDPEIPDAVHSVPVLLAAEDGVAAGAIYLLLMLLMAWRALRTSPGALAVAMSLAGFMAFDKFTYLHPNGLLLFAIWLGALDALWLQRLDRTDETEAPAQPVASGL